MLSENEKSALKGSPLFCGVDEDEIERFLDEIRVFPVRKPKNTVLIAQGERHSSIHIVLSGSAVGERSDNEGRSAIISEFRPGSVFGDMLSGVEEKSPVTVRLCEYGTVLVIPFSALLLQSGGCAKTREAVLRNLFRECSQKYFALMRRVDMLLCPTLRGKIALYLLEQSERAGQERFISPHTREQQAQLLACDRSALSRELSRLRQEGVITFSGTSFCIRDRQTLLEAAGR